MPMLDVFAFALLGASAIAALLCFFALQWAGPARWIWFGASLTVFLLVTRAMVARFLAAVVDLGAPALALVDSILAAAAALAAAFAIDAVIRRYVWYGRFGDGTRSEVPAIFIGLASAGGYALTSLLIASQIFHLDVTAVAATSGILAIVLGVSAQQTLGQVFAGLALSLSRPFKIGDSLQVDTIWGVVTDADWRAVTLRTYDGNLVTIPNMQIAAQRLTNCSLPVSEMRHHIPFVTDADVPPGLVQQVGLAALSGLPCVLKHPAPLILFKSYCDRGVEYEALFWHTDPGIFLLRRDEVGTALWYAMHRAGIPIAVNRFLVSPAPGSAPPPLLLEKGDDMPRLRDLLARSGLFVSLTESDLDALAGRARLRLYAPAERIFAEGEAGASMYLVLDGKVSVRFENDGHERELYTQSVGEIFGHMSAMTGAARFATVRALDHVQVAEFDKTSLAPLIATHPEVVEAVAREIVRIERLMDNHRAAAGRAATGFGDSDHHDLLSRVADRIRNFLGERRTA